MNYFNEIVHFFSNSIEQSSQTKLNSIIELCFKLATRYLHSNRLRINKILQSEEITVQELAIDCISELFVKDSTNNDFVIRTAFINWKPKIENEQECLYFLNSIVSSRVEQHLFKLLKEQDPFFSKILDSVNYLIKQSGLFKIQFLGKTYIVKNNDGSVERNFIKAEQFEQLPNNLFLDKKKLFEYIFDYLKNELFLTEAIPLNDLINKLKHLNFSDFISAVNIDSEIYKLETTEIIEAAIRDTQVKLSTSYFDKGKLDIDEKIAFEAALKDMATDLLDGGINPGLFSYLKPYILDLNENDYKDKYHNILEYLLKVMKNKIADQLLLKE